MHEQLHCCHTNGMRCAAVGAQCVAWCIIRAQAMTVRLGVAANGLRPTSLGGLGGGRPQPLEGLSDGLARLHQVGDLALERCRMRAGHGWGGLCRSFPRLLLLYLPPHLRAHHGICTMPQLSQRNTFSCL